jgi:nicotinamide-nucleotide amidase
VSAQTVEEMAAGAAKHANAEIAIAIICIAGPVGGTPDKPVGTVWFGFYFNGQIISQKQQINGDRQAVRIKAIEFALSNTLKLLLK